MSRDAAESDRAALSEILLEIGSLSRSNLQERWSHHFGVPAPAHLSRELLVLALSYAIQAKASDGLSADEWRALGMIAHGHTDTALGAAQDSFEPMPNRAPPRPIRRNIKPGTRLLREWQGRTYEVIADTDGGFLYAGEQYRSLSAIARQITGTRWSGPAFFGVQSSGQLAKTTDLKFQVGTNEPSASPNGSPLRGLHAQVVRGKSGAELQLTGCTARGL